MMAVAAKIVTTMPANVDTQIAAGQPTSTLPVPDANSDALASIYISLSQQQKASSKADSQNVRSLKGMKDSALAQEQAGLASLAEGQQHHRGMFGSVLHLAKDVVDNATKLDPKAVLKGAEQDAKTDIWNNPDFWKDLKTGAEIVGEAVAATGACVATGGGASAAIVVAIALSAASTADSHFKVLHALGVSDKVAGYIDMGCAVASAVITLGSTASTLASAADATKTIMAKTELACTVIGATTHVASGVATIRQGVIDGDAIDKQADVLSSSNDVKRMDQLVEWVVQGMNDSEKSNQQAKSTVQQTMQTQQATSVALTTFGKA